MRIFVGIMLMSFGIMAVQNEYFGLSKQLFESKKLEFYGLDAIVFGYFLILVGITFIALYSWEYRHQILKAIKTNRIVLLIIVYWVVFLILQVYLFFDSSEFGSINKLLLLLNIPLSIIFHVKIDE